MYYKVSKGNLSLDDNIKFILKGNSFIEFSDGLRIESKEDIEDENILTDVMSLTNNQFYTQNCSKSRTLFSTIDWVPMLFQICKVIIIIKNGQNCNISSLSTYRRITHQHIMVT